MWTFLFCLENILKHEIMGCLVLPQKFGFSPQMPYFKMKVPFAYNPKPSTLTIFPSLLL